ncbi:MAG: NAD(+) diphosphatase [Salaquimonas sp.]
MAHSTDIFSNTTFPEPSSLVGFSQNRLIRDAENRDEDTLERVIDDPAAQFYIFSRGTVLVQKSEYPGAIFSLEEAQKFGADPKKAVLLGQSENGPRIAIPAKIDGETLREPYKLYDYRSLLYSSSVSEEDVGAIAQGGSILYWHAVNKHCGKCGTLSVSHIGGYRRDCPSCDHKIFPRTDPVVIMLAVKDDKCLMGRSPHFPEHWYSTLAGFVEPGETIEDAVRRETFEESGIRIRRVQYFASQPWPFPHSLMIGVHCEAISDEISFQDNELEDCRWFTREDVKLMIADEHPQQWKCPPSRAIAHALIKAWVG